MSENSEALKRGYDAFNSGDADTLAELYEDDARWEGPNTDGFPMSGVHEGKEAILDALRSAGEAFEEIRVSPDEMVEQGDTIVVLSHLEGKAKSGNEVKLPGVERYWMKDGKASRVQSLVDTAEIKKVLGS